MIKAKKGMVSFKGESPVIEAEFVTIIKTMYENAYKPVYGEEGARQEIYNCIRLALASVENLPTVMENISREKAERITQGLLNKLNCKEEGEEVEG